MSRRDAYNRSTLRRLGVFAVAMFGFGFAMVPFYKAICDATGISFFVKPDEAKNTQVDESRLITIEFDANTRGLPWRFVPEQRSIKAHPGQLVQVVYEVSNQAGRPITGQAIPSYGPQVAAGHFRKLECFCFKQQRFEANETRKMPVVFVIDPDLPREVGTVTLSYTFFEVHGVGERVRPGSPG